MALQLKLSELIIALKDADNKLATIEDADEGELEAAREKLKESRAQVEPWWLGPYTATLMHQSPIRTGFESGKFAGLKTAAEAEDFPTIAL